VDESSTVVKSLVTSLAAMLLVYCYCVLIAHDFGESHSVSRTLRCVGYIEEGTTSNVSPQSKPFASATPPALTYLPLMGTTITISGKAILISRAGPQGARSNTHNKNTTSRQVNIGTHRAALHVSYDYSIFAVKRGISTYISTVQAKMSSFFVQITCVFCPRHSFSLSS
jgi:hypothetical protein